MYKVNKHTHPHLFTTQDLKSLYVKCKPEAFHLLNLLPEKGLSIVGSRNPHPQMHSFLDEQIALLKDSSLIILSGLALGIDAKAHQFALKNNLKTIAVLAHSHDQNIYPYSNNGLAQEIFQSGGLLISEYQSNTPPLPYRFLHRNRLIASLSKATWIVQAGAKSGALCTAKYALDFEKMCFVTNCLPNQEAFLGNQKLLDDYHAIPFWGVHSLGQTWLNLSTIQSTKNKKINIQFKEKNSTLLFNKLKSLSHEGVHCVSRDSLLNWAQENKIQINDFYTSLEEVTHSQVFKKFAIKIY